MYFQYIDSQIFVDFGVFVVSPSGRDGLAVRAPLVCRKGLIALQRGCRYMMVAAPLQCNKALTARK